MKAWNQTFLIICVTALTIYYTIIQSKKTTAEKQVLPNGTIVIVRVPDQLSETALLGEVLFNVNCSSCHGENAGGQLDIAPPLVHKIYEPNHHGDESFQLAVARGIRAHHWKFGSMPPIEGLTRENVANITRYIRELQKANNIF